MIDLIAQKLSSHLKTPTPLQKFKPSAVLIPVLSLEGSDALLFTVRNHLVRDHKGEICFPGGVKDEGDLDFLETALRECEEEIGLLRKDIRILGELDDIFTPTFYRITPFVGRIPYPYPFKINEDEIDQVLKIPLDFFRDEKNLGVKNVEYFGEIKQTPCYFWEHHKIWGATARMVKQLVELMS